MMKMIKEQIAGFLESLTLFVMIGTISYISWVHEYRVIAIILVALAVSLLFFQKKSGNP